MTLCMHCGESYDAPHGQPFPLCRSCHLNWDMKTCPDSRDHEWEFKGHASFKGADEPLLKVGECRRCGSTYLSEL